MNWTYVDVSKAAGPVDASMSRFYGVKGWLLVFAIQLCLQCRSFLMGVAEAIALPARYGVSFSTVLPLLACLFPGLLAIAVVTLLLRRKAAFRIVYCIYAGLLIAGWVFAFVKGSPASLVAAFLTSLWIVYLFRSDRVRITCGLSPRRPIPMPMEPFDAPPGWN